MGKLVNGEWRDVGYETKKSGGHFVRQDSGFRNWITRDGSPGPTGDGGFTPDKGRYHLFVSLACPWAHRTLIFRTLKGLEEFVSVSLVNPLMGAEGWTFHDDPLLSAGGPGVIADPIHGSEFLYEIYVKADPQYSGRVTVPVLWDKKTDRIVSNESSEIIRMFGSAFDEAGARRGDYYPVAKRKVIDEINERVYATLNNGVYRCGFATTQEAYETAFDELFATMDWLEDTLSRQRYLAGNQVTEADWRLFTTLVRFDSVYFGHFKTNKKRLVDYPNLWAYTRELYQWPGIAPTVDIPHIKRHYYQSHTSINPTQIVPKGPKIDFDEAHHREQAVAA
jgi:putative glutathione S-transferase